MRADVFLSVAEMVDLYRTAGSFARAEQSLRERYAKSEVATQARVQLAIIYAKRIHTDEPYTDLLEQIDDLVGDCHDDAELQLTGRLVRAVIVLTCAEAYREGLAELDELNRELRFTSSGQYYGLVRRWMGFAFMGLGRHHEARAAFEDAVSICRRYGLRFTYAAALNDYAVLKRRSGDYSEARRMLHEVIEEFTELGAIRNVLMAIVNLGNVAIRTGDWRSAEKQFARVEQVLSMNGLSEDGSTGSPLRSLYTPNVEYVSLLRRQFGTAEERLLALLGKHDEYANMPRVVALAHEFLGEVYLETGQYQSADEHLRVAESIASEAFPESDVMTEILRRRAELQLACDELRMARETIVRCTQLCLRVKDPCELGAAERVLGSVYVQQGHHDKAGACFRAAVHTLKSIHDCYELMRTLYAQGKFFGVQGKREDAEVALLEGRQLAKKLELDYYQALIAIALVDTLGPQERFDEANTWLNEATALRDSLEGIDRERVEKELKRAAEELQVSMTRASVRSAETLKTICRVYEDARFPFEELKPDLAYQVAQSVGGECLFVIGRHGGGFRVPLTYNIAINEAKDLVRQMDPGGRKGSLLGVNGEPRVLRTPQDRTLVAVPCSHEETTRRDSTAYILCTRFEQVVTVTPRQLEILCASAEALARLIEVEEERQGKPADGDEDNLRVKHPRGSFKDILTIDPEMIKVIRTAERAATSVAPILLEGETGVGKELFASAIHGASRRKDAPFVAVNAGGLSVHLIESELFGHVKGSFTGANGDRVGLIESARSGTLFLDEIGEMSEELQVKLLRLLENGEYRRLGESTTRQADVRIISATNRDLKKEVDRGSFRRDLFYRVSPIRLNIPPLRLRARDIQLLVRHFLRDCAALNGIADRYIEIDVKAMEALELYDWPGNVRELYNEILRLVSLIGKGDLVKFAMLSDNIKEYLKSKNRGDGLLDRSVEQYERRLLLNALDRNDWNRMRTADSVGVPRTTLIAKLKRLNVASKEHPSASL